MYNNFPLNPNKTFTNFGMYFYLFRHNGYPPSFDNFFPAYERLHVIFYNIFTVLITNKKDPVYKSEALIKMKSSKAYIGKDKVSGIVICVVLVFFMSNLNAMVDFFLHPEIPYFDKEHLIVGSITGMFSLILFGFVLLYFHWMQDVNMEHKKAND